MYPDGVTYTVILAPEETGYSVLCPAFGIASQGDSRDEALRMITEAIEMCADLDSAEGRPVRVETVDRIAEVITELLQFREEEGQPPLIETTQVQIRSAVVAA